MLVVIFVINVIVIAVSVSVVTIVVVVAMVVATAAVFIASGLVRRAVVVVAPGAARASRPCNTPSHPPVRPPGSPTHSSCPRFPTPLRLLANHFSVGAGVLRPAVEPRQDSLASPYRGGPAVVHRLHLPGGVGRNLPRERARQKVSYGTTVQIVAVLRRRNGDALARRAGVDLSRQQC